MLKRTPSGGKDGKNGKRHGGKNGSRMAAMAKSGLP